MRVRLAAVVLAAASASLTARAFDSAQAGAPSRPPDLKAVLARAAAYVEDFREKLSGIVAEETYVQQEVPGERREVRSDLLLVRSETFPRWLQFRDTFEVDGKPVRDRAERLTALFLQPPASARAQAQRIADESSRYNLGELRRTINVPVMPLVFLEADVQKRIRFTRAPDTDRPAAPQDAPGHFKLATEVWVVRFEERDRPTIVRDLNSGDVPTEGRFWIEPESGRVLMSEMRSNHPVVRADVTVSYQSEPLLGMLVPIAMRETYTNLRLANRTMGRGASSAASKWLWRRIEASATYGRFRQFQVHVEQDVDLPDGPIDKKSNDERPNER
jgi:hypothetical protein